MLLKEKVENAFESLKDSDRMNEWSTSLIESPAGVFVAEQRVAAEDFISEIKERFVVALPFASDEKVTKLEKKITTLTKKINQLKKTVDSFEE